MKKTYVDAGVLIAAARGVGRIAENALQIISDTSGREFVCSDYVRIEVVPKPAYFKRSAELRFYEEFFASVSDWLSFDAQHMTDGFVEACNSGLSALDAVHVVLAAKSGCTELVTSERTTSAIHRTKLVPIVSIDPD